MAVVGRAEALEQQLALLGRHADAAVGDLDHRAVAVGGQRAAGDAAGGRVAQRVGQQVRDDAADALGVEARRDLLGRLDGEPDPALGGERVELLGDRAHGGHEVVVDQRQAGLAVVAADLLEHGVDLLERVQRGQADALGLGLGGLARVAAQALGAREDDLQRRPQVVRELGQQPLAVVVDAGQPVGQHRQLGVLARDPLLRALAVGDLAALGDDEGDAPVGAAQRPQHEVDGLRRPCRRCPASARRRSARSARRRPARRRAAGRPARPPSAGTTASATAGGRSPRGGRARRRSAARR